MDPTKDELGTDSHIVKVREFASNTSKFGEVKGKSLKVPEVRYERKEIIELGFH